MKKLTALAALVAILTVSAVYVELSIAAQKAEKAEVVKAGAVTPELVTKKKAELNGTTWNISLTPMGGKGKAETDTLTFADDKVSSANLDAQGFAASGFSVRMKDDGTLIWETMQTSEKEGIAFWRGDINEGVMRGVLSKRDKKENTKDFNFISVAK